MKGKKKREEIMEKELSYKDLSLKQANKLWKEKGLKLECDADDKTVKISLDL